MSEVSIIVAATLAVVTVVSLALTQMFLLIVYFRGGRDDLLAAAKALREVRDVGVGPSIRAVMEARKVNDKPKA